MEFNVHLPHEHEHEHEEVEVEVFSILNDEGREDFYKKVGEVELEGQKYWVCQEVFLDENLERIVDEGDIHVFKEIENEGEVYLEYVDDYDLAKKVFDIWEEELDELEGEGEGGT